MNKEKGAEERFKEISNAYEVLTDDNKKQIYDRCVFIYQIHAVDGCEQVSK